MLMGDVAKKAFNMITKKMTKKNVVPSVATYKLRSSEIKYKISSNPKYGIVCCDKLTIMNG